MNRLSFKEALQNGLPPDGRVPVNAPYLKQAKYFACTPYGGKVIHSFQQPITDAALTTAGITKAYPFPQLFVGKSATILADATALYTVTRSDTSNWTITAMPVYDYDKYNESGQITAGTIPSGKEWHFVDMFGQWMLFNGSCVIFTISGVPFVERTVTINTGATYNDAQLFYGGFNSTNVNSLANWIEYLDDYQSNLSDDVAELVTQYSAGMSSNWVWWSSIGAGDMYRFFSLEIMKYGLAATTPYGNKGTVYTDESPYWMDLASRGESGCAPMPWTGSVQRVLQCGNAMIAYASNGVRVITPPTYGIHELPGFGQNVGLCSGSSVRLAVGGNEQTQMFVDERRDLWVVENNGGMPQARKLGYRNIFDSATNLLVHHDAGENEFYFTGDSEFAYRLPVGGGMSKSPMLPTTVAYGRANSVSGPIGIRTLASDQATFYLETNWFDNQGTNTVPNAVRIIVQTDAADVTTGLQVALAYKRFPNDPQSNTTGYVTVDHRGVGKIRPTDFYMAYVQVTHPDRTTININDIIVEYDDGQRRSIASCLP